jgi:L-asparaginase
MAKKRIALISTGGTIEKSYDEQSGTLHNKDSMLDVMLSSLMLEGVELDRIALMNKDSLEMTADDHRLIAEMAGYRAADHDGVVIVHGTDTLSLTGEECVSILGTPQAPIVLTGAMRPFALRATDSLQNLTESLLAVQLLSPGVYLVMHDQVLQFPGVVKDRELGTFVKPA